MESVKYGTYLDTVGYKYSSKNVSCFIYIEVWVSTFTGKLYEDFWVFRCANLYSWLITHPQRLYYFFDNSNNMDMHNQDHQSEFSLENILVTHNT